MTLQNVDFADIRKIRPMILVEAVGFSHLTIFPLCCKLDKDHKRDKTDGNPIY